MKKVILGVCGSISAYKSADIVRQLVKKDIDVNVVMTSSATKFITPLTMQVLSRNNVYTNINEENDPLYISHISLVRDANLILIAPATANFISKIANGIADDFLTSMILAVNKTPIYICPSMNTNMYNNNIIRKNISFLKQCGMNFIDPKESLLACGDFGVGALQDTEFIISKIINVLGEK